MISTADLFLIILQVLTTITIWIMIFAMIWGIIMMIKISLDEKKKNKKKQ